MAKIRRTWARMNRDERIQFADTVKTSLTGNANVPTPKPTLVDFTAAITLAAGKRAAISAMEAQLRTLREEDAVAQDALVAALDVQSATVESATSGDPVKIATTGFVVTTASAPPQPMTQPLNFSITASENEGAVDGQCDPVAGASSYEVQTSTDPNNPALWVPKMTITKSSFTISGLTSGQRVWVRIRAIGALGPGPWSDPSTKIVP